MKTLKDLTPDPQNARQHNPRNIAMIEESIRQVGVARSGVIDENGVILAGNGTYDALASTGIERVKIVPADGDEWVVVQRTGLTAEQKRILSISDNRASDLASWNGPALEAQGIDLQPWFTEAELEKATALREEVSSEGSDQSALIEEHFNILIECQSEQDQRALLERLTQEGWVCRALIS